MEMIVVYKPSPQSTIAHWVDSFCQGLRNLGIDHREQDYHESTSSDSDIQDCDIAVFWSHRLKRVIERQKDRGKDYVVLEHGYINRPNTMSIGFNGLNGRADFRNHNSPPDRWEKLGIELKPWRKTGDYILICGQVRNDMALESIHIDSWYNFAAKMIKSNTDLPIVFRPHPVALQRGTFIGLPEGTDRIHRGTLEDALADADTTVTYSSSAGVESAIIGTPVIVSDVGSMAWPVASWNLFNFKKEFPDRKQWAYDLAYTQWNEDEVRSGEAWSHLTRSS